MERSDSNDVRLAGIFKALGDPNRLRIYHVLRECGAELAVDDTGAIRPVGSMSVGEICCQLSQSPSTISHHLKELRSAGLIQIERRGRWIFCSINSEVLGLVANWAERSVGVRLSDSD